MNVFSIKILLLCFVFFACVSTQQSTTPYKHKYTVSGKVEQTGVYCGGIDPGEEVLRQISQKSPFANFKIYVRKGTHNSLNSQIIDSCETDSDGNFSFSLPNGNYVLLSKYQKDKSFLKRLYQNKYTKITNRKCLNDWWQSGLLKITVKNNAIDTLYLHFQKTCFLPVGVPCLMYDGPLPP